MLGKVNMGNKKVINWLRPVVSDRFQIIPVTIEVDDKTRAQLGTTVLMLNPKQL